MSASDVTSPLSTPVAAAPVATPSSASASPQPRPVRESETPAVRSEPLFPERNILLKIDEATQIVQTEIRDAVTGEVLRELPDDQWLRLSAKLRAFAATAIVDKSV